MKRGEPKPVRGDPRTRAVLWGLIALALALFLLQHPALLLWALPTAAFGAALWWAQRRERLRQEEAEDWQLLKEALAELRVLEGEYAADLETLTAYLAEHPDPRGAVERARLEREHAAIQARIREVESLLAAMEKNAQEGRSWV